MKIDVELLLRATDAEAYRLIEIAMAEGATPAAVTIAAAFVRYASELRRKCGASNAAHEDIAAKYLSALSSRLMEVDQGENLYGAKLAAEMINPSKATTSDSGEG